MRSTGVLSVMRLRSAVPTPGTVLRPSLAALVVFLVSGDVRPDIVHLKNGRSIEGTIERDREKGTVTILRQWIHETS